jgi:succinate dehydrogenase / fumarate reductase cytochrome b subunit
MSAANRPSNRPLSPHLQVYRLPLLAILSILHRATGVALSVGALYLATWVIYAASNPQAYALFQGFNTSIGGRILLGGWLFSAFYHLFNGIRHLFWDAGYGFELKDADVSAWIVIGLSGVATALSWIVGLRLVP